jgi:methylglutaconyl-CoA hydratase
MTLSTESPLALRRTEGMLEIVLTRSDKANALTAGMMDGIAQAVAGAHADEIVLLSSASPTLFCAGADIREFVGGRLPEQEEALLVMIKAMAHSRAPIVAIARGRASGAGAVLLCLADVVIAAEDLQVACPEFVFGMYPIIVEAVLQSRLSPAIAAQMCLGAGVLTATQAREAGIVTELLPTAGFADAGRARVGYYIERRYGLAGMRRARNMSQATRTMCEQLEAVAPLMMENFNAPGVRERIAQYLDGLARR